MLDVAPFVVAVAAVELFRVPFGLPPVDPLLKLLHGPPDHLPGLYR